MSQIKLENVTVRFPLYVSDKPSSLLRNVLGTSTKKSSFEALKSINLDIDIGERVALLGRNGSGKSTLLRLLAGMLPATEGDVTVIGEAFSALTPAPYVIPRATCIQNIILQGLAFGLKGDSLKTYIEEVKEFSELGDFLNSPYNALSTGMKGRFAVSTLKGVTPQLLFMDEWIGTSDKLVVKKNKGLLYKLVETSEIFVLASHRKQLVKDHCDRAIVLDSGSIVFDGDIVDGLSFSER